MRKKLIKLCIIVFAIFAICEGRSFAESASEILKETEIKGGLIVHLGCGDGKLTSKLYANKSYLVHGLDSNSANIAKAREYIKAKGIYGKVSVELWGKNILPYNDNIVNLLICDNIKSISEKEIMRVLVPNGVAYIKKNGNWTKVIKPRPENIDDWTHYLHNPSNNAVAQDTVVGPPKRLQWDAAPKWGRSHEKTASLTAMVSDNGRIFYLIDKGSTASVQRPANWTLMARDAFNGILLWEKKISKWDSHLWPLKAGPVKIPRRLVAKDNKVYFTLGIDAPVSVLAGNTGEEITQLPKSDKTEEIIVTDKYIIVQKNDNVKAKTYKPESAFCWSEAARMIGIGGWKKGNTSESINIYDKVSNKLLWSKKTPVTPLTLTADKANLYFCNGENLICLDLAKGEQKWSIKSNAGASSNKGPILVVYGDKVLFSPKIGSIFVYSIENGKQIWKGKIAKTGHMSSGDLIVINNLIWSAGAGKRPFIGQNLTNGKKEVSFSPEKAGWFHNRCHRSKASINYLISSRTGIEFADVRNKTVSLNHWVRGGCLYGIMPANGLIYTPPNSCACMTESKPIGLNAFASAAKEKTVTVDDSVRLQKGNEYKNISTINSVNNNVNETWLTYRHNNKRSGFINTEVSEKLSEMWSVNLQGKITPLVATKKVVICSIKDKYSIVAIDINSGNKKWSYSCNATVDSPPTIYKDSVIFGSKDGWVYSLNINNGKLIWRYLTAVNNRRLVSFGKVESVWPNSGSVLVQNDIVHIVAGRSMFLDGGLQYVMLNAKTGELIKKKVMNNLHPEGGRLDKGANSMPTAMPDILSCNGKKIFMRSQQFDLDGNRLKVQAGNESSFHKDSYSEGSHLFSPNGFLDTTWMHRNYWLKGFATVGGWPRWFAAGRYAPAGRIMSFNNDNVFVFGRKPEYFAQSAIMEYQLYGASTKLREDGEETLKNTKKDIGKKLKDIGANLRRQKEGERADWKFRKKYSAKQLSAVDFKWINTDIKILVKGMVLTKDKLFIAGPKELLNEEEMFDNPGNLSLKDKLREQELAWQGKKGGIMQVYDITNGKKLAEYALDAPPVFDGMIVIKDKVIISQMNGKISCYKTDNK